MYYEGVNNVGKKGVLAICVNLPDLEELDLGRLGISSGFNNIND
jgi:hypothetical protein